MSRLTTIIICLVLSAILGFLLLWPQYQKFSEARWQVKENETERNNQEEYFADMESLSTELENYQEQKSKIVSAIPSGPDIPALLNFLANTSSKTGMILKKISSFSTEQSKKTVSTASEEEKVPVSRARELTIDFEVGGEYTALKNFISALESNSRIIEVESISFKKKTAQEGVEATPSYGLKIKAFYY